MEISGVKENATESKFRVNIKAFLECPALYLSGGSSFTSALVITGFVKYFFFENFKIFRTLLPFSVFPRC